MTVRREEMRGSLGRLSRGDHTVLVSSYPISEVVAGRTATREIRQELMEDPR
jgi:hypothetical protein